MTKTYCDCCGEEVELSHMRITFNVSTNFRRPGHLHTLDVCEKCHGLLKQDGQLREHMVTIIGKLALEDVMETDDE